MYGKRKSGVFFAVREGFKLAFWKFHSAGTYVMSSQRSNVQITIPGYNNRDVFELRCYRVANFTSSIEFES